MKIDIVSLYHGGEGWGDPLGTKKRTAWETPTLTERPLVSWDKFGTWLADYDSAKDYGSKLYKVKTHKVVNLFEAYDITALFEEFGHDIGIVFNKKYKPSDMKSVTVLKRLKKQMQRQGYDGFNLFVLDGNTGFFVCLWHKYPIELELEEDKKGKLTVGKTRIVKADKSIVSQKEVLQWRKDFSRIMEIVNATTPDSFVDAVKQREKVITMFKTFFENLQQWLDYHVLRTPAKTLVDGGGMKSKYLQPLFDKFENYALNAVEAVNLGYYVYRKHGTSELQRKELQEKGIDLFSLDDWARNNPAGNKNYEPALKYAEALPDIKSLMAEAFAEVNFHNSIQYATKFFDAVREFIGVMGEGDKKGAKQITYDDAIHPEYQAFNLTFVNKAMLNEDTFGIVVRKLTPFMNRLKKFIPEIFYGGVILLPEEGYNFALKDGSGDSKAAASYAPNDTIIVYCKNYNAFPSSFGTIMVHELGHRYYRKKMDASDRAKWGEFFKKGSPASEYGSTDPEEDFCESLAAYIGEKVGVSLPTKYQYFLSRDVFDKLEAIVGRRLTAQVDNFYKDFTASVANKSLMQIKKGVAFDLAWDKNKNELWITKNNEPIWRSGSAGISAIVKKWNQMVEPSFTILEQWLADQLKDTDNVATLAPWQNLDLMKIGATVVVHRKRI